MSKDINIDLGFVESLANDVFGGNKQVDINGPKINVSSPVDVKPNGEIDFTPVYDDINKESKDIKKKVEIPVEVELTAQQQQIKDQIISLLNRVASRQDYKKEGQINQDWFNRTIKQLERSVNSGNIKNINFTKQDVEKAFLLRGIANKEYKPRSAINIDQKSLDLISRVLNEDYITGEINKFLNSQNTQHRPSQHSQSRNGTMVQFDQSALKEELDSINQLDNAVKRVTDSVNAKTEAFKKERDLVQGYVSDEEQALQRLERTISKSQTINNGATTGGHQVSVNNNASINGDYQINTSSARKARNDIMAIDYSGRVNSLRKLNQDGTLDLSSTYSALSEFKSKIQSLSPDKTLKEFTDIVLDMRAFDEVLKELTRGGLEVKDELFKISGNQIEPYIKKILDGIKQPINKSTNEKQVEGVSAEKQVVSTPAQISNYSSNNKDLDDARFRMIALSVAAENAKENLWHLNSSIEILNDTFDKINSLSNQLQKSTAAFDAINKIDLSSIQNNIQDISSLSGLLNEYSGAVGNALKSTSDLAENLNQLNSSLLNLSKNNSSNTDQLSQKENAATQIQKEISAVDEDISATKSLADVKRRIIQKLSEDEKLTNYAKLGSNVAKYEAKYGVKSPFELDPRHADAELADIKDGLLRFVNGFRKQISQMFDGFIGKHMPGLQNTSNPIYTNINPNSLTTSQLKIDTQKDIESVTLLIKKLNEIQEKLKSDIPSAVQVKTSAFQQEQQDVEQVVNSERKYFEDFEKYLSGQFKDSVNNSDINTLLTDESNALPALTQQITNVTKAVELKTNAFKTEHDNVLRWIKDETDGFDSLASQASDVSINLAPKDQSNVNTSQGDFNNGSPSVSQNRRYNSDWNLPALVSALRKVSWQEDESNNLPPDDIKILTKLLSGSIGSLHGYYKGARQIATGKFSLDKLDDYLYKALPLLDVINSLPDIEQYANLTEIDAQTGQSEYVNKALHSVYEAFKEEQQAIVNSTSKLLEQGNLISDISSILYDGSKPLIDRMNELAKYAINNAGAIHSSISKTEEYDDAKSALKYLGRNASKHHIKTALLKEGLLPSDQKAGLPGENNEWNYYYKQIQPLLDNIDSLPDDLRKKLESFRKAEEHIINDVVKDAISAAQQRAADLGANALTNNSPTAKANRAINRLSSQQRENEYQTLKLFQENGMLYGVKNVDKLSDAEVNKLLDDQAARLKDLTDKRKEEYAIIKLAHKEISDENGILKQQWQYYKDIVNVAKEYAQQRLNEAGRNIENNPYKKDANNLYDIFYRAENFNQKKQTVGIVGQEESALQSAISDYEELRKKLEAIAVTSKDASDALKWLDDKQSQASDKLKNKWSDARDRRYGSYLNENDERGSYRTRDDVLLGLQRYASRQGADGFKLFDGKSIGNIQKYRAEINGVDGTIEKLNLTLNKTTHELYSVSMGTKQSTSFFESFGEGLKRRAINLVQYAMTFASIRTAIQGFRAAINTVKDLDSAFVELSRISHDSSSALEEFRKKSFDVADAVGSTAAQVINAAAQWEHLGYNVKEASELAEVQMIYKNIADGMSSDAEATEDLVSIMKAYDFQANQAIDVTDALIAVSNNYAVTAADIGNALKRSASAMAVANNTFEQNVALATAMAEVTQNAEKSGSALQVLSLRIRGAKTELQEMGEDTEGMASSTSKLRAQVKGLTKGFDIMKDDYLVSRIAQ